MRRPSNPRSRFCLHHSRHGSGRAGRPVRAASAPPGGSRGDAFRQPSVPPPLETRLTGPVAPTSRLPFGDRWRNAVRSRSGSRPCLPSRDHRGSAPLEGRPRGDRLRPPCGRPEPRSKRGCRAAPRTRSPPPSHGHGRSPRRSRRRLVGGMELPPRPPSRRPRTAAPPCCRPRAPSSPPPPQRPIRLPSGRTNTSVPSRRVHGIAVDLEPRPAAEDDVELLDALVLLVLGHEPVARVGGGPCIRPERRDPEVVPHGPHVRVLTVGDVLQFLDRRNVIAHSTFNSFLTCIMQQCRPLAQAL